MGPYSSRLVIFVRTTVTIQRIANEISFIQLALQYLLYCLLTIVLVAS
jgi:hypothetical protein